MKVKIRKIEDEAAEQIIIECVRQTKDIIDIKNYIISKGTTLSGSIDERIYQIHLNEVYYFEAVGERVFAYTDKSVYELKSRLYEIENSYKDQYFLRCSKSVVLNLMKIDSLSPALNGRFTAHMKNEENIIISRQYVGQLKSVVLGGK
jgi:DNA-binding LytR/AlgR family response regulator